MIAYSVKADSERLVTKLFDKKLGEVHTAGYHVHRNFAQWMAQHTAVCDCVNMTIVIVLAWHQAVMDVMSRDHTNYSYLDIQKHRWKESSNNIIVTFGSFNKNHPMLDDIKHIQKLSKNWWQESSIIKQIIQKSSKNWWQEYLSLHYKEEYGIVIFVHIWMINLTLYKNHPKVDAFYWLFSSICGIGTYL